MLYRPTTPPTTTISTSGRSLAHTKLKPSPAGAVAAQIVFGERRVDLTIEQAAHLTGANLVYTRRAMWLTPEQRVRVATGCAGLQDFPRSVKPSNALGTLGVFKPREN